MGAQCFLCERKLCPDCCPEINTQGRFKVMLFLVCFNCIDPNRILEKPKTVTVEALPEKVNTDKLFQWRKHMNYNLQITNLEI